MVTEKQVEAFIAAYDAIPAQRHIGHRKVRVRAALEAAQPRVKPLIWRDAKKGKYTSSTIVAESIIGDFCVTVETGAAYFDNELCGVDGVDSCQRVYENAILSALTTEGE